MHMHLNVVHVYASSLVQLSMYWCTGTDCTVNILKKIQKSKVRKLAAILPRHALKIDLLADSKIQQIL